VLVSVPSQSSSGVGVSGTSFGSEGGIGVRGEARATSGFTCGVCGSALSPNGVGVSGSSGTGVLGNGLTGVQGVSSTPSGVGIRGVGFNGARAGRFDAAWTSTAPRLHASL
jgi:hypothetical protein